MKLRRTLIILAAVMLPLSSLSACGDMRNADDKAAAPVYNDFAAAERAAGDAPDAESVRTAKKSAVMNGAAESLADDTARRSESADESPIDDYVDEPVPPGQYVQDDPASALILTAGEWNDNKNWGFFSNLVSKNLISFPAFGLNPLGRVAVTVEMGGKPARNIAVELAEPDGTVLWKAQTDRDGSAFLFYDARSQSSDTLTVRAAGVHSKVAVRAADDAQSDKPAAGDAEVKLSVPEGAAPAYTKNEVMFILDTTGSMGDEILYLQKDFSAIAEETAGENVQFSMNFYRDKGDAYVTRCNPFTSDVKTLQTQLNGEKASGGGDSPEAVAEILTETITNGSWSADANKLAFLIFDAPPHNDSQSLEKVEQAVRSAAEQGIHIVPVVASNSARETELFGRALAAMTNSNYVFLTDDSGVGASHLEPIIGDYDVEKLHDIIVRNIKAVCDA